MIGMVYSDPIKVINKRNGIGNSHMMPTVMKYGANSIETVNELYDLGMICSAAARDLTRIFTVERTCQCKVYTIATQKINYLYYTSRHEVIGFNTPTLIYELSEKFGFDTTFEQVCMDYFFYQQGWDLQIKENHSFFAKSLKYMCTPRDESGNEHSCFLGMGGSVYLPMSFLNWQCCLYYVQGYHKKLYTMEYVSRNDLVNPDTVFTFESNVLYDATELIDSDLLSKFGKQPHQEEQYCRMQKSQINQCTPLFDCDEKVLEMEWKAMEEPTSVRFLKLTRFGTNIDKNDMDAVRFGEKNFKSPEPKIDEAVASVYVDTTRVRLDFDYCEETDQEDMKIAEDESNAQGSDEDYIFDAKDKDRK